MLTLTGRQCCLVASSPSRAFNYLSFEELGFPGGFWCSKRLSITKGCKSTPLFPATFLHLKFCFSSPIQMLSLVCEFEIQFCFTFFLNEQPFSFFQKTFPSHVFMNTKLLLISPELFSTLYFFSVFFFHYFYSRNAAFILWFSDSFVQLLSSHGWSCRMFWLFVPMWCSPVTSVYALSIKPVGSNGGLKCSRQNAGQMQ